MRPPIKNLIGGVEESHTREYLLKISAQMMGCRERSKNRPQEQQEQQEQDQNSGFWKKRERGEEEVPGGGSRGPQAPCGRGQGLGRASWPPGPLVGPPCWLQDFPGLSRRGNFYLNFSGIFLKTSLLKFFRSSKSCETL